MDFLGRLPFDEIFRFRDSGCSIMTNGTVFSGWLVVFLYNCIFGYTDLTIGRYVTFITHGRPRSKNRNLVLKPAYCKTTTFQASFFQ